MRWRDDWRTSLERRAAGYPQVPARRYLLLLLIPLALIGALSLWTMLTMLAVLLGHTELQLRSEQLQTAFFSCLAIVIGLSGLRPGQRRSSTARVTGLIATCLGVSILTWLGLSLIGALPIPGDLSRLAVLIPALVSSRLYYFGRWSRRNISPQS